MAGYLRGTTVVDQPSTLAAIEYRSVRGTVRWRRALDPSVALFTATRTVAAPPRVSSKSGATGESDRDGRYGTGSTEVF